MLTLYKFSQIDSCDYFRWWCVSQIIWYLVVYLDLCECVVVSQRVDHSLNPRPGDEVGLQVQTSQRLVGPQHVTERLGGGTRK